MSALQAMAIAIVIHALAFAALGGSGLRMGTLRTPPRA
jgi:hypothetical protein